MATVITIMPTSENSRWYILLPRDECDTGEAPVEAPFLSPSRMFLIVSVTLISVLVACFVAVRPIYIGTDTDAYINIFHSLVYGYPTRISDPLFVSIALIVGSLGGNYKVFFFVCALILFFSSLYAHYKLIDCVVITPFKGMYITFLAFGLLFYSPFYFNMHVNILRHGMAVPFLLLGYLMVAERRYIAAMTFLFLSLGFHHSSLMHLLIAPIVLFKARWLVVFYIALSVIYLTNLSGAVLGPVFAFFNLTPSFESIAEYGASSNYRAGIRYDFWLFTSFFIGLSVVAVCRGIVTEALARVLIVSSIPFLLFGYIAYSDRLLVFSWFIVSAVAACCVAKILMNFDRTFLFVVAVLFNVATMSLFIGKLV